jgi:ribose transport system ATP-binding protein
MAENLHNPNILEIRSVSKSFARVEVLREVNLDIGYGETLAILGENGAGKSTLVKTILGIEIPDSGDVWFDGSLKNYSSPMKAYHDGISAMFQETSLVPQLTVLQNVFLGSEILKPFGVLDEKSMIVCFESTCLEMDIQLSPDTLVGELSVGKQKLVEIIKALTKKSRFIIMDEPTDSLSPTDTERLLNIIECLKLQNVSVLYISHKLEDVFKIADRIIVLRDGKNVFTSQISNTTMTEAITKMVGEPIESTVLKKDISKSESPILKLSGIEVGKTLDNISFEIYPGEVVGLTGLLGAGKSELAKIIFGLSHFDNGELLFNGVIYKPECPRDAIDAGIYLIPEDRKNQGLYLDFEIYKNITITNLSKFLNVIGLRKDKEIQVSENLLNDMSFRGGSPSSRTRNLSGGNQQKVVVSKWLHEKPKLLILDEPTKGIDVKARQEIIHIVRGLAAELSCGVLYLTSDFNEVRQSADRVLLLHHGCLVGEVESTESVEKMMQIIFNKEQSKPNSRV